MDNETQTYTKVTVGFVTQQFQLNKDGQYICIEQSFIAGDQVNREDGYGDPVVVDISKEVYQSMNMEQPI